ncbi:S-layer homology domain-containing protein [Pseudalkalibacillus salsuginis]|uniref:S-layer homology domain-containing protein n=1 Tax=Pseudalkalibacillus salsuginis TaxID=2910972 RepID=UPI001F2F2262|nr:S-layer homology domain-containing protein [Pseudalkalibacillus salsuginis]MCF6410099.1 S-layer homology domain-containing protein [Pseudalkalibacillus salsuginis]
MKKLFNGVMIAILLLGTVLGYPFSNAKAEVADQSLFIDSQLKGWILDDTNGNIYAITDAGELLVISRTTFEITNTVSIGTGLSDLDLNGNTLYVAMQDQNKVARVNLSTFTVDDMISLTQSPFNIEVLDGSLYYAYDQHSEVRIVDLTTQEETALDIDEDSTYDRFYNPDLESNESGILYIAESGSSGSHILKVSLDSNSIISESTYDTGYGFPSPERKVILDENEAFYSGKSLDKDNLEVINGTYKHDYFEETVLDVTEQFVLTNNAIYDRDEYYKVELLPFETEHILASMTEVYLFDTDNMIIHKKNYNLPTSLIVQQYPVQNQKVTFNQELTDWVIDRTNKKIYAVSEENNKMLTINAVTMEIENEQSVGSFPSDIDLAGDKLYIADYGSTYITVIDLSTGALSKIKTKQNPYRIATDGQTLFYVMEDQWTGVYKINLTEGTETVIAEGLKTNDYSFYKPDIEYDSTKNTLYIAESGSSGSHLYTLNPDTLDITNDGTGFSFPERKMVLDGEHIYYAQRKISEADLTNELWNYNEEILSVSNNYVISSTGVYSKTDDSKAASFPYEVSHASINTAENVFLYVPENKSIYKFNSVQDIINGKPEKLQTAINSNGSFQLSWDRVTADYYQVSYNTGDIAGDQPLNSNELVDNQLMLSEEEYNQWAGQTVAFSVQSIIGECTSEKTIASYTFAPEMPPNFTVVQNSNNDLLFDWDLVTTDFYKLFYKTSTMNDFLAINDSELTDNQSTIAEVDYQQWSGQTVTFGVQAYAGEKSSEMATYNLTIKEPSVEETPEEEPVAPADGETGDNSETTTEDTTTPDKGEGTIGNGGNSNDDSVDEPSNLFDLDNAKIVRRITTFQKLYEYKEDVEDIALNLHESLINEMNETGDEGFYIETQLGSFKLPINTIDAYTDDENSYIQVSIKKVAEEISQDLEEIAKDHFFELISQPIDFSLQIVENGTSTTVTSYGDQFVERRIPINDPSALDDMMVVVLDPVNRTYQSVPTTIEQDENGQYWAIFHRNGNSIYALVKTPEKPFDDVVNHWAKGDIEALVAKLIIKGVNDNEFEPERSVNRAEFAAMITRALGLLSNKDSNKNVFSDVDSSKWYNEAVYAARDANLINGYEGRTFKPGDTLTREEMITMIIRGLELVNGDQEADLKQLSPFKDGSRVGEWAKESVDIAIDKQLVNGKTTETLAPKDTVTRAEAATVINRLLSKLQFN